MIFDMIDGCLGSLENLWRDTAQSFQRLAAALNQAGLPNVAQAGNPNPLGAPQGLQLRSEQQRGIIQAFRQGIPGYTSVLQLFQDATTLVLTPTSNERDQVDTAFITIFPSPPNSAILIEHGICGENLEQLREFIARCRQDFEEVTSPVGGQFSLSGIRNSAENIAAYPLLTSEVTPAAPAAPAYPSVGGVGGMGSFQRTIDGAFREVLGRMPRAGDPRSFVSALKQSFELSYVEGHTEFKWTPRNYAGQTELGGGVTGAQASLYARARVSLDNSLPLLDGLYPLLPEYDPQLIEAARATVRTQLTTVVNELAIEGGPRVTRTDDLFESLLGPLGAPGAPLASGHLFDLRREFGLEATRVNTLEEETNLTSFVLMLDYTRSLRFSWIDFRTQFLGRDLGTRLVLLSRALSVAAEAVHEVYAAMDSVFVGAAERQVASFRDATGGFVLVEELLSWVMNFASEEAPRLVHDGGRYGVGAIIQPAQRLEELVAQFLQAIPNEPTLPDGLRHPRVRNPLQELQGYLRRIGQLAQDVRRP
jgi:hypothetical protein